MLSALEGFLAGWVPADAALVADCFRRARWRIDLEARLTGHPPRDYACTLLVAAAGPGRTVFGQIGDGAAVFVRDETMETAFWPDNGEYANATYFLTGDDWQRRVRVREVPGPAPDLALLTDGLQPIALHYATRTVHVPFFRPMFAQVRAEPQPERLLPSLRDFLQSTGVNARTDDDKTLMFAVRSVPTTA